MWYFYCQQVHICMSRGETFPNLHGQLDVTGLAFQIYDAPSSFSVCLLLLLSCVMSLFSESVFEFAFVHLIDKNITAASLCWVVARTHKNITSEDVA